MPSNRSRKPKNPTQKPGETAPTPEPQAKVAKLKSARNALVKPGARFSEEWMTRWLDGAADAVDMADACRKVDKTIADYLLARTADREFDAACLVFDQIVDLRITDTVRRHAEEGTIPAQAVYYRSVRRPAFMPDFESWKKKEPEPDPLPEPYMPARVADAMIKAGLEEFEKMTRASELGANPPDELRQLPGPVAQG